MQQIYFWKRLISTSRQEITRFIETEGPLLLSQTPPISPNLKQINSVPAFPSYSCKVHFNIII